MCSDVFSKTLSFFKPEELARFETVCKNWGRFIHDQWKRQCQIQLGIPTPSKIDPTKYLPKHLSYKEIIKLTSSSILDERVYQHVGKIGPVPRIPEAISLKRWNDPDPCDPTKTIGMGYVWMYCPPYIEVDSKDFYLDNPNDLEAPRLIRKGFFRRLAKVGNEVLEVPVTINNIATLFETPKTGNPLVCSIWDEIVKQIGDRRIPEGWICMKRNVIARNLPPADQEEFADSHHVMIPQLSHRFLFNVLEQARSKKAGVYPDGGEAMSTFARTATSVVLQTGVDLPLCCGQGIPKVGLMLDRSFGSHTHIGVAAVLPPA